MGLDSPGVCVQAGARRDNRLTVQAPEVAEEQATLGPKRIPAARATRNQLQGESEKTKNHGLDAVEIPKRLAKNPYIKALGLRVYPQREVYPGRDGFIIIGGSEPHVVYATPEGFVCDCRANSSGRDCSHLIAVRYLQEEEKRHQLSFQVDRTPSGRGTPVPLPRRIQQVYGGLFSGWFLVNNDYGQSIGIKCLATHVPAGASKWEPVAQITEAVGFISDKWHAKSPLWKFVKMMTGAQDSTLSKMTNDEIKEAINDAVGSGLLFSAGVRENRNRHVDENYVDKESFEAADVSFSKLAQQMKSKIEVAKTTQGLSEGCAYLAKPRPICKEDEENELALNGEATVTADDEESAIPF